MTERKTITYEEIAYSNMMSIEALVSLLTRKGLITEQEILDELKAIKIRDEKGQELIKFSYYQRHICIS